MKMQLSLQRSTTGLVLVLCCFLAMTLPARADTGSDPERWKFSGATYLWASGVEGTDVAGDEIDVSFTDALEHLDGGIMGILGAQKGRWSLLADFLYLSLSPETTSTANIIGIPTRIGVDVKFETFVTTFGVGYRVLDEDTTRLDLLAGARYVNMDVDFDANVGANRIKFDASEDALDGVIGAQAIIDLSEKWYLSIYADVGTGDSKLTWQAWPAVGYRFKKVDALMGYRQLKWETDNGDFIDDLSFKGPMLGVVFRF